MSPPTPSTEANSLFVATRWSVVLTARNKSSPDSAVALEALCHTYWYPLYVFIRRQGRSSHDAQDLTQEFFARLVQKDYLQAAAPEKGRFRTFMRVALKRFLANEWDRTQTLKRGGGNSPISLDALSAEDRYRHERADMLSPDRIYERRWAMTLLDQVMRLLRIEYTELGKVSEFEELKGVLTADRGTIPYCTIAQKLKTTEGASRVAVHRMRKRFRELFRSAVADTVAKQEEVDHEIRYIVAVLSEA